LRGGPHKGAYNGSKNALKHGLKSGAGGSNPPKISDLQSTSVAKNSDVSNSSKDNERKKNGKSGLTCTYCSRRFHEARDCYKRIADELKASQDNPAAQANTSAVDCGPVAKVSNLNNG